MESFLKFRLENQSEAQTAMTNRANQLKKVRETFFLGQSVSESEEISNTEKSATRRGIANLTKDDNFRLSLAEKGPTTDNQLGNEFLIELFFLVFVCLDCFLNNSKSKTQHSGTLL